MLQIYLMQVLQVTHSTRVFTQIRDRAGESTSVPLGHRYHFIPPIRAGDLASECDINLYLCGVSVL